MKLTYEIIKNKENKQILRLSNKFWLNFARVLPSSKWENATNSIFFITWLNDDSSQSTAPFLREVFSTEIKVATVIRSTTEHSVIFIYTATCSCCRCVFLMLYLADAVSAVAACLLFTLFPEPTCLIKMAAISFCCWMNNFHGF